MNTTQRAAILALLPLLAGCAAGAEDNSPPHPPPSLALVPPSYYYHYRYSPKLHRRVREVIPSRDLEAVPPEEERRQRLIEAAGEALYRLRRDAAR